jgi:hypothetical protein
VPRHVTRLVTCLIAPLVINYFDYAARPVPWHVARLVTRLVVPLVVDYFAYATRPGASARRATRHVAHRRLLRLCRMSGCLGTSRGSSRGTMRRSLSASTTPRVWVSRHIAQLITWLVIDYSVRCDFVLWPHWLYFSHAVRCDYLPHDKTGSVSSTPHTAATSSSGGIASAIHLD